MQICILNYDIMQFKSKNMQKQSAKNLISSL